ncbi:glycoside hydrolase family 20 zincin-like fold domain-containing protein [Paenibacillus sp. PAMC21692]|uniref:glycoside hydrolase family 20 zincin-like fold domain-containing protein n=1 Tax=Paenibacillus sp. PAMC21692 TaxID=2762320 RepID=UPI00164E5F17|nr:glycoside hydrolase family 20 zincin-like fold domain-containing protein [Paenibacillus sp. PAMC21692]QNK56305.1 hypothetical protein H7F31_27755 [Paenibacillus sp. PAMC21692]
MIHEFEANPQMIPIPLPHFPTRMQAVIWRNYGLVPTERIAVVLGATVHQIEEAAGHMGLKVPQNVDSQWLSRGYITIIRANWHLLTYEQILILLDWTEEKLEFTLKEDDFLWVKLGYLKPFVTPLRYKPLSPQEKKLTLEWKQRVSETFDPIEQQLDSTFQEKPFDFLERFKQPDLPRISPRRGPLASEVRLDVPWTIQILHDENKGEGNINIYAQRFVDKHAKLWGVEWSVAASHTESPVLQLKLDSAAQLAKESYTLIVSDDEIVLQASDEDGIMRGLQWIEQTIQKSELPYFEKGQYERTNKFDLRYIYSYSAVYGDPLLETELDPYPDEQLERLSEVGVNGIWMQSVLYQLAPWRAAPELSVNWEQRIEGLRKLVEKALKYGIRVYLYFNEPRSMPLSYFKNKPDWKGHEEEGYAALCTSVPEVQAILSESVSALFREVPGLGGIFAITMSENLTNCYSKAYGGKTNCPRCSKRSPSAVISEVIHLVANAVAKEAPAARVLCYTWAWTASLGWDDNEILSAIKQLPSNVTILSVSEDEKETNIGNTPGKVIDYSISVVGPSEKTARVWQMAKDNGLKTAAKVQFNNSWELSAVPYLPVFQLIEEHLRRLNASGVSGLMLSWTLGGYPSLTLRLAAEHYWSAEGDQARGIDELLEDQFGTATGKIITQASLAFSEAFRQFPFDVSVLYLAPQNIGPANLLYMEPTNYKATMVGIPYDDLDRWRAQYSETVFANQFKKLSTGWKKGLKLLDKARKHITASTEADFDDLYRIASASYLHFYSAYMQILFVKNRKRYLAATDWEKKSKLGVVLIDIAQTELDNALALYALVKQDSRIGFEASNHYFYTAQDLKEKAMNCHYVLEQLMSEGKIAQSH